CGGRRRARGRGARAAPFGNWSRDGRAARSARRRTRCGSSAKGAPCRRAPRRSGAASCRPRARRRRGPAPSPRRSPARPSSAPPPRAAPPRRRSQGPPLPSVLERQLLRLTGPGRAGLVLRNRLVLAPVPLFEDRRHELPGVLDVVAAGEERRIAAHAVEKETLVSFLRLSLERPRVGKIHVNAGDAQIFAR